MAHIAQGGETAHIFYSEAQTQQEYAGVVSVYMAKQKDEILIVCNVNKLLFTC